MEMKSSSEIIKSRNAISNIVSTFKDFPWTALQQSLKDTNIINTINQLLSIYHPDDGIIAYERVLKALLISSENLDNNIQRQIISVVPLPKGVSNDKIRNLIYKITELIKAPNIKSSYQKVITVPEKSNKEILNDNSKVHLNQNILLNTSNNFELNEKFVSSVPEVFKGFPPNEISTIHNHVNYMYDTLNYNISCIKPHVNIKQNFSSKVLTNEQEESLKLQSKIKWFNTPHLLYKTNFCQNSTSDYHQRFFKSMDDKYFQLSIDRFNNWNHCNITDVPYTLNQNTTCLKKLHKNNAITNKQNKNEILNLEITCGDRFIQTETNYEILHNDDVNKNSKKYSSTNKNKIFNMETQYFKQELKDEQAIQQDIYKMDVVHYEEERKDTIINIQTLKEDQFLMDDFTAHKNLKRSLQSFLKRAEQETLIEFPILPWTKSLYVVSPTSKRCKIVNQKNLENNTQLDVSSKNINNSKNMNTSGNIKKFIGKKSSTSLHIYQNPTELKMLHKSLNTVVSKTKTIDCEKKDYIENLLYKSATKQTKQKSLNTLQQTASITELVTFKKQYYDTLLNIQKAKMAVANSLAISSVENFTKYDPYYSNHSYQKQQLLQHGPLIMNPQFAVHTMTQSGLSNIHDTPWVRYNNWRHSSMKHLRHPQQFPFQVSRNKENSVLHYVKTMDIQCFTEDKNKQMKQSVQRRKLEDIVGKLKEIENNNTNN